MEWTNIIVALIAFMGTAVGAFSGFKLVSYRVEQLEKKVEKHNGFEERILKAEERIKVHEHRIEDVERKVG